MPKKHSQGYVHDNPAPKQSVVYTRSKESELIVPQDWKAPGKRPKKRKAQKEERPVFYVKTIVTVFLVSLLSVSDTSAWALGLLPGTNFIKEIVTVVLVEDTPTLEEILEEGIQGEAIAGLNAVQHVSLNTDVDTDPTPPPKNPPPVVQSAVAVKEEENVPVIENIDNDSRAEPISQPTIVVNPTTTTAVASAPPADSDDDDDPSIFYIKDGKKDIPALQIKRRTFYLQDITNGYEYHNEVTQNFDITNISETVINAIQNNYATNNINISLENMIGDLIIDILANANTNDNTQDINGTSNNTTTIDQNLNIDDDNGSSSSSSSSNSESSDDTVTIQSSESSSESSESSSEESSESSSSSSSEEASTSSSSSSQEEATEEEVSVEDVDQDADNS